MCVRLLNIWINWKAMSFAVCWLCSINKYLDITHGKMNSGSETRQFADFESSLILFLAAILVKLFYKQYEDGKAHIYILEEIASIWNHWNWFFGVSCLKMCKLFYLYIVTVFSEQKFKEWAIFDKKKTRDIYPFIISK